LGELDVVVADDLDAVAPRVAEIEELAGQGLDTGLGHRPAHRLLVVDHQAKVPAIVGRLLAALLQGQELVAEIDESHAVALAAKLEIENTAIERQRFLDIADLQGDVVETDGAGLAGV